MEKHLKSEQEYRDRYDRRTVELCRETEKNMEKRELSSSDKGGLTDEEAANAQSMAKKLYLHFEMGERYLNKEKTLRSWMEADRKRDEFYEAAQPPVGIRCLTCRNQVKPTFKEFMSGDDSKSDRVLFMFDCPNKCLPRRAFYSDGEEWRVKLDLCPRCDAPLSKDAQDSDEKLVATFTCQKCGFTKTDELVWTHPVAEPFDEHFAVDRDRFCLTDEEGRQYQEEKWNMERLGVFMKEWEEKEKARAEKLAANPQGFHLDGAGYTCFICGNSTPEGDNWYDQYGIKCLVCQKAIDVGEIPATLAKDQDSWYSKYDLDNRFNLKTPTLKKWVKDGVIKKRTISRYGEGVHYELFLIEDNQDFLPPKELTKSQSVREIHDGKEWYVHHPWYQLVKDPHEHLKSYRIKDFIKISNSRL